jgi:hypothetical protein
LSDNNRYIWRDNLGVIRHIIGANFSAHLQYP